MTAILDADSILYSIAAPHKVLSESGEPLKENGKFVTTPKSEQELLESTFEVIDDILRKCGADSYLIFIKGEAGQSSFRKEINPAYKANRSGETPEWWPVIRQELESRYGAITITDGYEVDDYVNVTRLAIPGSFIVAIDKDLLNLTGRHYNWKKDEWITVEAFQENYWFWKDMIVGQPGDNIKGLPKKGEVFAEKALSFQESYRAAVLELYCEHFGEYRGIEEFYKNFMSLKILTEVPGFLIPIPYPFT